MTSIRTNGNTPHRKHRKWPWKEWAEIAAAIATLVKTFMR